MLHMIEAAYNQALWIQHIIRQLISGDAYDVLFNTHSPAEVGLPSNVMIWQAMNKIANYREKSIKAMTRGGILFQKKEDQPDAEIETAIMVYVFYTDHTWSTFFVFADGTNKEMQPPGADYPTP